MHRVGHAASVLHRHARPLGDLRVPHNNEWGPSVQVDTVCIEPLAAGTQKLRIEMQSGDAIEIVADRFNIPNH
jgi:hypothetical protein